MSDVIIKDTDFRVKEEWVTEPQSGVPTVGLVEIDGEFFSFVYVGERNESRLYYLAPPVEVDDEVKDQTSTPEALEEFLLAGGHNEVALVVPENDPVFVDAPR